MLIPWRVIFFRGVGSTTNQIFSLEVGKLLNPTKPTYRGWKDISPFGWMCRGFSPALVDGVTGWPVGWGELGAFMAFGLGEDWGGGHWLDDTGWLKHQKKVRSTSFVVCFSNLGCLRWQWQGASEVNMQQSQVMFWQFAFGNNQHPQGCTIKKRLLPPKKVCFYPGWLVWSEQNKFQGFRKYIHLHREISSDWICLMFVFSSVAFCVRLGCWNFGGTPADVENLPMFCGWFLGFYIFQWLEGGFWPSTGSHLTSSWIDAELLQHTKWPHPSLGLRVV